MVKANELRIGNYVQHEPYSDELWKVDIGLLESIDLELVYCVGIPLTPEILEECRFKYKSEFYTIGKDLISFIFNEGKLQKTFVFIDTEFRQIRYLHELQNLYFALTGKELEIKELK